MKILNVMAASALLLLLSACASSGMHDGMVYRDGSWYAPASDGRGDYYTSMPRLDAYDHPFDFSVGLVPYGGYCPVRYRYCMSYWDDPFHRGYYGGYYDGYYGGYRDPFYDPFWYQSRIYYRHAPRLHHRAPPRPLGGVAPRPRDPLLIPDGEESARPTPEPWQERPLRSPRDSESGSGEARPRRSNVESSGGG